jgi:sugar lactone lactonase YvrE
MGRETMNRVLRIVGVLSFAWVAGPLHAASVYPVRLDDPHAVYLTPDRFPVAGDGVADDADALQQAIDAAAAGDPSGVLFVPEGVAVDAWGRVYIAAGPVRVFDPEGRPIDVIRLPQRATSLAFGGPERNTLFVTARSALYRVQAD